MLLTLIPASVLTVQATHGYLLGDANDDSEVSMKDILLTRKFVAGNVGEKEIDTIAADVDLDEEVTLKDILKIRKAVAGTAELEGNNEDKMYKVDSISIGGRNIARYTVVIPEDANDCVVTAASQLVKYVNMTCGIPLNVVKGEENAEGYRIV